MENKVKILDCTLRDGGYINDWNFTRECYDNITAKLQEADVDIIELGIMGSHDSKSFRTKYRSLNEVILPPKLKNKNSIFAVMMTGVEYKKLEIPKCTDGMVDTIRYAFFKADCEEAVVNMKDLIKKGYRVFAQTMATFEYSEKELVNLIKKINDINPYAFYIVDSFGTMYPEDISHLYGIVNSYLNSSIYFGFHAHNNIQMANANVIEFIKKANGRDIIVDGSIYGMGRGAGNASTELIMHYLNQKGRSFDEQIVWQLFNKYISVIKREFNWGYLPEQYLVSAYHTNPAYIWYLSRKGITEFDKVQEVLSLLPDQVRYTLVKEEVDSIIEKMQW